MNTNRSIHAELLSLLQRNAKVDEIGELLNLPANSTEIRSAVINFASDEDFVASLSLGLPMDCARRIEAAWLKWCRIQVRPRLKLTLLRNLAKCVKQINDGLTEIDSFCMIIRKDEA